MYYKMYIKRFESLKAMLIFSILFLLLSNAVTLRRDKSILFSRISIIILLYSILLAKNSLYMISIDRGIGIYSGLFHITSITQYFIYLYLWWERAVHTLVVVHAQADLLEVIDALGAPRRFAPDWTAGKSSGIRTAMIAMTTNNSISVNPRREDMIDDLQVGGMAR